jgi:hypothetical protein
MTKESKMKVTITDEEVKFLANMINLIGQTPNVTLEELGINWANWVASPLTHHTIKPKEARAILIVAGILIDHGVSADTLINKVLECFVENYNSSSKLQYLGKSDNSMRQNYSCNICGLKSFVMYSQEEEEEEEDEEDEFDIAIKIREDHEKKEPTCPCSVNDLNIVGEPTKV